MHAILTRVQKTFYKKNNNIIITRLKNKRKTTKLFANYHEIFDIALSKIL